MNSNYAVYKTKIGYIKIEHNQNEVTSLKLINCDKLYDFGEKTQLTDETIIQINEYLEGKRKYFDIPISLSGTDFQKKVWNTLQNVKYGKIVSYKEIAKLIGNEKACRAVGMACNKNPILIIVPCHRVIGKNGQLTGYSQGLNIKKHLLDLEKQRN